MPSNAATVWLLLFAVFIDYAGVALVLPNLMFRWKDVGITPAGLGLASSIYSCAQLVGALIIGYLGDRRLGRKQVLLVSFAGAGISYLLVGLAESVWVLGLSRVLVGLVKQTQTCSSALLTGLTSEDTRAQAFGRLSSASMIAGMVGQSAGGVLSTYAAGWTLTALQVS